MEKYTEKVTAKLKEIIDRDGPDHLTDKPYEVYLELMQSENADKETASMILYALANGVHSAFMPDSDIVSISNVIENKCSLNRKAADYLAEIFLSLYSKENRSEWEKKSMEGVAQFLAEEFICTWRGFSVWDDGNGTVDCHYHADVVLSPTKDVTADRRLAQQLKKKPFITKQAIHEYFEKELYEYLDNEFEEYCTCDDYYPPVAEDFEIDYYISEWAERNGFEMISCDGNGDDGEYELTFRKGVY